MLASTGSQWPGSKESKPPVELKREEERAFAFGIGEVQNIGAPCSCLSVFLQAVAAPGLGDRFDVGRMRARYGCENGDFAPFLFIAFEGGGV